MEFKQTVRVLNRIKSRSQMLAALVKIGRSLLIGLVAISIWAMVSPENELEQVGLGLVTVIAALFLSNWKRRRSIEGNDVLLAMEMDHQETASPASTLRQDQELSPEWQQILRQTIKKQKRYEWHRLLILASTLILPAAVSTVTLPQAAPSLKVALAEVGEAVATFQRGASLKIVKGASTEGQTEGIELKAGKKIEIELLAQNMIEITVQGGGFKNSVPTVELYRKIDEFSDIEPDAPAQEDDSETDVSQIEEPQTKNEQITKDQTSPQDQSNASASDRDNAPPGFVGFQTFQLAPAPLPDSKKSSSKTFKISFAVTEPVELSIPVIDDKPLASIKVKQLPVPKVRLSAVSTLEDPWPDDQPLALRIDVKAENPLQFVRLLIKSGGRVSKELVANVMTEDKLALSTVYDLILEPYVESDFASVEIIAEAIDRSIPTPLAGYSKPLRINTASAYGRYRQTLRTLKELKSHLDESMQEQKEALPEEAEELAKQAAKQSDRSPFFDGRDRVQIQRFQAQVANIQTSKSQEKIMDLSEELNDFLFEHELLDNRERDRDFFVAVRSLSRLIEQPRDRRPVTVKVVADRLDSFLDERQKMWELRVARLANERIPKKWQDIKKKPFNQAMERVKLAENKPERAARGEQLEELSTAVVEYREWIEALEAAEDEQRDQEDQERQEGIANARNVLRELQQRQGEVSKNLDRAASQSESSLQSNWPSTRMKQNTNLGETKRLEGQLRSLSPTAGLRIKAALESMEGTLAQGNEQNFAQAESSSDLAGRMLRQADQAAQQSQKQRRSRGRRRRVAGDNYYGQSVVGGDIEITRDYQVDRRYREDVLNDIQGSAYDDESRTLLENYLREIVR